MDDHALRSALLSQHGFEHAFFLRGAEFGAHVFGSRELVQATQVHGSAALIVAEDTDTSDLRSVEADALLSCAKDKAVGVRTADCVPVLIADARSGLVAAVHAGWRGIVDGVVDQACSLLAMLGGHVAGGESVELVAAIGPHIRPCCFEVGAEVIEKLDAASGVSTARPGKSDKPHGDMAVAVRAELLRAGVSIVDDVGGCTMCDAERFFSYRRDGALAGRLIAAIAPR